MKEVSKQSVFTPILIGGSLILLISFAIRSTFGLFQIPIASEFLWNRSEFSLAIAIQNLAWGIGTPLFSAFAEKYGDRKAISLGLILYAIGIFISSSATTPEAHQTLNLLIGFGIAGSGFGPILAVVGRELHRQRKDLWHLVLQRQQVQLVKLWGLHLHQFYYLFYLGHLFLKFFQ